ncbi:phosphatase PAP2 family protein [Streptomyces buecherae]|uniref:phosphatase PAP2 family protein n=1 Tax=Streptomyces buecherae TaxID=2763006 RepID=UPI001C26895F|nr:phosphatase PAP2 family protein [Streptomyces buecherae]
MRETPRSQETVSDAGPVHPQPRSGRAMARTTGVSGSGSPHRSDGRPPHTPRGARRLGRSGGPGTTPLVPGLPFPRRVFLVVVGGAVSLLVLITWQVAAHGPLRAFDERLSHDIAQHGDVPSGYSASTFVAVLAEFGADLGGVVAVLPALAAAVSVAAWRGYRVRLRLWWLPPLTAALALGAVPALVAPLKAWLGRPGPNGAPLAPGNGYYPSGHAATAAVGYGAVLLLIAFTWAIARPQAPSEAPTVAPEAPPTTVAPTVHTMPRAAWWWSMAALACLNAGVGLGLVRRGYHWPLDVLGSWCLSVLLLSCVAWSVGWALSVNRPAPAPARGPQPPRASPTPAPPGR